MPTLDEALEWARGKTIVILDKKNVPVEVCVKKIEEHRAEAYAMVMAYSFQDIQNCHDLSPDIMMEVMIGDHKRFRGFDEIDVPWSHIVAFVGHTPPEDKQLLSMIHAKRSPVWLAHPGTSTDDLRSLPIPTFLHWREYRSRLEFGVDLIETDLPIQVGDLLYAKPLIPESKSQYFHIPMKED